MTFQAQESPTRQGNARGALGRFRSGSTYGLGFSLPFITGTRIGRWCGPSGTEHVLSQVRPENGTAFLIGNHRRKGIKLECENDLHQEIPGRQTLPVTQIGRVRVRNVNSSREFLVSHSHDSQYVVCVTRRQRGVRRAS